MVILRNIQNFDLLAFNWCLQLKYRDIAVAISRVVSHTADGHMYVLLGILLIYLRQWPLIQILLLGFLIERTLYFIFKSTFKRNRPPDAIPGYTSVIEPSDKFSFPSGHTSAAFLIASFLSFILPEFYLIWYAWACLVGIARVMLGVHFPTDTLVGASMGWLISKVAISFVH